jgi:hypothetical protein
MPYPELYAPEEPGGEGFHPTGVLHTMFVDIIDQKATEAIVAHLQAASAPVAVAQPRVLGGAMARVPAQATAFAHRTSRFMVNVAALYQHPQEAADQQAWVDRFAAVQHGEPGPMSTSSATKAKPASTRPTPARPGTTGRHQGPL